jgi:transcriptional regulator with XRE-family HTH domain
MTQVSGAGNSPNMQGMERVDSTAAKRKPPFALLLKELRTQRRLSQLGLALESEVAQRHISFLESGRARPGRDVILKLATGLDLSLRATNSLLTAAGFAGEVEETPLDAPALTIAKGAIEFLLERIEPCPAILIDADWNVHGSNTGAARLLTAIATPDGAARATGARGLNLVALLTDEKGLVVPLKEREQLVAHMQGARTVFTPTDLPVALPFLPTTFVTRDRPLSFLTILASMQGSRDVTLEELRVEIFFPADEVTKAWLDEGKAN